MSREVGAVHFFEAHVPGSDSGLDSRAKLAANDHLARIMSEDGLGYTRMPGWHTETSLGQNLITAFNLDANYCSDENLYFMVSEALAALSMAIQKIQQALLEAMQESDNPEDHEEEIEALQSLFSFAVQAFLGTQIVAFPGKTLRDFGSDVGGD